MIRFFPTAIALSVGLSAQSSPSRVAMDALLDIRFFLEQGRFLMATSVPVLFPPPAETKARLLIEKAGGGAVVTKEMMVEPWPPQAAFGNLKPADGQVGLEMLGKEICAYPFCVKAEKDGDPFDPKNSLVRTGPWSTAAFLMGPVDYKRGIDGSGYLANYA